jgi:hypothetical protein
MVARQQSVRNVYLVGLLPNTRLFVIRSLRPCLLFRQRLRNLQRARGTSQEALAELCGYDSYTSRFKRGAGNPSVDAIEVLASALEVEAGDFFRSTRLRF